MPTFEWLVGIMSAIIITLLGVMGYYYTKNRNAKLDMEAKIAAVKKEALDQGMLAQKIQTMVETVSKLEQSVSTKFVIIETRADEKQKSCNLHAEHLAVAQRDIKSAFKVLDEHKEYFREINRKLDHILSNQG
jgi:hypothetical protein